MDQLRDKGIDDAIGSTTDTDSLMYYLEQNHLHFSNIYTSEDLRAYKPDIRFYQGIIQKSGWVIDECLFVGDSYVDDVCGPKRIGMKAVLLDREGKHEGEFMEPKPDQVIHSLSELVEIVENM